VRRSEKDTHDIQGTETVHAIVPKRSVLGTVQTDDVFLECCLCRRMKNLEKIFLQGKDQSWSTSGFPDFAHVAKVSSSIRTRGAWNNTRSENNTTSVLGRILVYMALSY